MNKKITSLVTGTMIVAGALLLQISTASAQFLSYQGPMSNQGTVASRTTAGPDIAVNTLLSPFNKCDFSNAEPVTIIVTNNGDAKVGKVPVSYKIGNAAAVSDTIVDSIAVGAKKTFTFAVPADLTALSTYTIVIESALPGDLNANNNKITIVVTESTPKNYDISSLFTGFETTDPRTDTLFDLLAGGDPNTTWTFIEKQVPRTGKQAAALFTTTTPSDDWFITKKCMPMLKDEKINISFWYGGNGIGASLIGVERLEVRVGQGKAPAQLATRIFADTTFGGTTYRQGTATFIAPADGTYFIGFHGFSPGRPANQGQNLISIDDLKINKVTPKNIVTNAILSPKTSCTFTTTEPITVTLKNTGSESQTGFEVSIKASAAAIAPITVSSIYNGPAIAPGESVNFTFDKTIDLGTPAKSAYTLITSTEIDKAGEEYSKGIALVTNTTFPKNGTISTQGSVLENSFDTNVPNSNPVKEIDYSGWEQEDTNNDSISWIFYRHTDPTYPLSGDRVLGYFANSINAQDGDDYYFSKCMTLKAAQAYVFAVNYRVQGPADPGASFELTIGNDQTADAQSTKLVVLEGLNDTEWTEAKFEGVTVPTDGTYYVAIHATSPVGTGTLYMDDFNFSRQDGTRTGVSFNKMTNTFRVYPNPAKDAVNIQVAFEKVQDATITVTDVLGKVVAQQDRKDLVNDIITVDLSNQPKGIYFVRVQNEELNIIKKVVLAK